MKIKINVGTPSKRGKFPMSFRVNTTMPFGRVFPLWSKFMIPGSSIRGDIANKVRVMPLAYPPFGKVAFHQYAQFVPYGELWRAWPSFVSGQPIRNAISGSENTFDRLPSLPMMGGSQCLMAYLFNYHFSIFTVYECTAAPTLTADTKLDYSSFRAILKTGLPLAHSQVDFQDLNYKLGFDDLSRDGDHGNKSPRYDGTTAVYATGLHPIAYVDPDADKDLVNLVDPMACDYRLVVTVGQGVTYLVCVTHTAEGRALRNTLMNLGIVPNVNDTQYINMLPLFAFYKAWFDTFAPQQLVNWQQTRCYALLSYLAETSKNLDNLPSSTTAASTVASRKDTPSVAMFEAFLYEVSTLFATDDPNYFNTSVHSPVFDRAAPIELDSQFREDDNAELRDATITAGAGTTVVDGNTEYKFNGMPDATSSSFSRVGLRMVNALGKYVNKSSVTGRNIDKFFKSIFNGYKGVDDNSRFAGSHVTDVELGDVLVTADTEFAETGEYAGVGFGDGQFDVKYSTKEFGIFIIFGSIIPYGNFTQGTSYDNYITQPLELPQPVFDNIGYEKVRLGELVATNTKVTTNIQAYKPLNADAVLGYQPRYTGHKVQSSMISGDFSLPSVRDSYGGFTLDNIITVDEPVRDDEAVLIYSASPDLLQRAEALRYLARYPFVNNYNRIFRNLGVDAKKIGQPIFKYNGSLAVGTNDPADFMNGFTGSYPVNDGFLVNMKFDMVYSAPLENISECYDTKGDGDSDHYTEIS